jgi:hypothetical protein
LISKTPEKLNNFLYSITKVAKLPHKKDYIKGGGIEIANIKKEPPELTDDSTKIKNNLIRIRCYKHRTVII